MSTLAQVAQLKKSVDTAKDLLDKYTAEYNKYNADAIEYNRQSVTHAQNGNYDDATIAAGRRDSAIVARDAAAQKRDDAATQYQTASDAYEKAVSELNASDAAVYKTQQAANYIQGTTKYLIWGAVALVIVIGVVIFIRKRIA